MELTATAATKYLQCSREELLAWVEPDRLDQRSGARLWRTSTLEAAKLLLLARREQERAAVAARAAECEAKRVEARERAAAALVQARDDGNEIFFLASLDPAVRDKIATKEERAAALDMRSTSIMCFCATKFLGCTRTELDRWDADERCPHLFLVLNPVYRSKAPARKWALLTLSAAKDRVGEWRAQDALAPRRGGQKQKTMAAEYSRNAPRSLLGAPRT